MREPVGVVCLTAAERLRLVQLCKSKREQLPPGEEQRLFEGMEIKLLFAPEVKGDGQQTAYVQ